MSIKVLVISNYTDFHSTRPEASIFWGLAKRGFDITIMTYGKSPHIPAFQEAGIKVIDFHPEKKFDKAEVARIRDYIVQENIQIMHLFNGVAIVNGLKAAKGLPVKVVLYRGYCGNVHWYDPTAYLKYLNPRVDKIFCNSIGVEEMFRRQLFFDKSKAVTINKGHDIAWYQDYKAYDIRTQLGLAPDTFLLVNVANNRDMKGIPYLLEAMNQLPESLPIHLLLIGRDMENKKNMAVLNRGNAKSRVHFLGHLGNVLDTVASSDVFVLSSIKGESITKSVIEAMAIGIPPIITDIPGNRELVVDGISGLVVRSKNATDLRDAMVKLYTDEELRLCMGKAATQHIATNLNEQQTIDKTQVLYEGLVRTS